MEFSEKRAGQSWIKSTLCLARDHALEKGLKRGKLIVGESRVELWVVVVFITGRV